MKKITFLLLIVITASLFGCNQDVSKPEVGLLQFEEIPWNSSPEYILSLLPDSEFTTSEKLYDSSAKYVITVDDWLLWNHTPVKAVFHFNSYDLNPSNYGLSQIKLYLSDSTDFEVIQENLKKIYGNPVTDYTKYWWDGDAVRQEVNTTSDNQLIWCSKQTYSSALSSNALNKLHDTVCLREESPFSESDFELFIQNHAVTLTWVENAFPALDVPPEGMTRTFISFDASAYVMYLQLFDYTHPNS